MSYPLDKDETLNAISQACGKVEEEHGFREEWELASKLEEFAESIKTAKSEQDLPSTDEDADILIAAANALRICYVSMKLMLTVSELAEALESLRDTGVDGITMGEGNFGEETADAHIRLWSLEQLLGINNGKEVIEKIAKNDKRPYKHGRLV